ncbi:transposase domain-containing protein [Clostridium bowmanii]|uniref:transposase domain-containing protein n=1 Tax=Clostridium bowmanii TaxID=132925 RepID=UPI0035E3FCA0
MIYSIIETAEENDLKPYEYLTYLFEQLPNTDVTNMNSLDKLLPWSDTIPENCKAPAQAEAENLESAKA